MGGQTAQSNLVEKMVLTINSGGVVIILGWSNHHHFEASLKLSSSKKFKFITEAPGAFSNSDLYIFTNAADNSQVSRVKRLTRSFHERPITLEALRGQLQVIAEWLKLVEPPKPETLTTPVKPVSNNPEKTVAQLGPPLRNPELDDPSRLSNRLLELNPKLTSLDKASEEIATEINLHREAIEELKKRCEVEIGTHEQVIEALKKKLVDAERARELIAQLESLVKNVET